MPQDSDKNEAQEIAQEIEFYTRKLAVLLHHLKAPEKIKQAWAALLPKMSLKQISELLDILEARYLDEQTRHLDKALKQEVAQVVKKFEKQRKINSQRFVAAVKTLSKKV